MSFWKSVVVMINRSFSIPPLAIIEIELLSEIARQNS